MKNRIVLMLALLLSPVMALATVTGTATSASFICSNSTGPFPFTFSISDATAMTATQNGTVLSSSAYTIAPVNGNYDNGGSVTLVTSCPNGQTLVLQRVTPITQLTQFTQYMPALYTNIENGLDKLTEIDQDQAAIIYPLENPFVGYLYWNGNSWAYQIPSGTLPSGCAFSVDLSIPCGGTGATTAAGALVNLGAVSTATTVNGHALSSNVTVSASDLTTGTLPHAQLPTLLSGDIPNNAANTTGNAATATYATSAGTATDPTKLPLTGGTLTGALNGTSASFLGTVTVGASMSAPVTNVVQTVPPIVGNASATIQAAITSAGVGGKVELTPGAVYTINSKISMPYSLQIFDCKGATLLNMVSSDHMVELIGTPYQYSNNGDQINNCNLKPGVQSTASAIHDQAWQVTLDHISWLANGSNYFSYGIQVEQDEKFLLRNMAQPGGVLRCDSTFCGSAIYATPGQSALGKIESSDISMACKGNSIDWNGEGLALDNDIVQAYSEWGVRGSGGSISGHDVWNESGTCTNPIYGHSLVQAGYIMDGGTLTLTGISPIGGTPATFAVAGTAGTENYTYYVVAHNDTVAVPNTYQYTMPMPIGNTTTANATLGGGNSVTVQWPTIPYSSGNPPLCDLLRVDQTINGRVAPYPGNAFSVAVNIPCDQTVGSTVTYTDTTPTASLAAYSTIWNSDYGPTLPYWPGSVVLSTSGSTSGRDSATYTGNCGYNVYVSELPPGYSGIFGPIVNCIGPANEVYSGIKTPTSLTWESRPWGSNGAIGYPVAILTPTAIAGYGGNVVGAKGVWNTHTPNPNSVYTPSDVWTLYDSNYNKTLATTGNRAPADAGDSAVGLDGTTNKGVSFRDSVSISSYINSLFDGTSWLERLTSTAKSFKAPVKVYNNLTVAAVATPSMGFLTTAATGGTLSDATTYYYVITAVNAAGSTAGSVEKSKITGTGGNLNTITIPINMVDGATGYNVYRSTSTGTEIGTCNASVIIPTASTLSYVDTGTCTNSAAFPVTNTTAGSLTLSVISAAGVPKVSAAGLINSSIPLNGSGAGVPTGPSSSTPNDLASFTGTLGQLQDTGVLSTTPAKVNACGTTAACANTLQASPRIVWGTVALTTGSAVVGSMTAWTSTTSFLCNAWDITTIANTVSVANTNTTSITLTGTGTDTIGYRCMGN